MAIVRIDFSGGDVPVVVGEEPGSPDIPMADPVEVGTTNSAFIIEAGIHCFGLLAPTGSTPLWQVGQAIDGQILVLSFGAA